MDLVERTIQRWQKTKTDQRRGPRCHARKLSFEERESVLRTACAEEFFDDAPAVIVAKLADQGKYLASEKTIYRLLKSENLLGHRSRAKIPVPSDRVATVARRPNEVWCWDITNMRSPYAGVFFKLYMYEDIYSRKIVGWNVEKKESEELTAKIFTSCLGNENISGAGLRVHSDNGNPMRGVSMLAKYLELGVRPSFSRPSVSNDNPFIESLF